MDLEGLVASSRAFDVDECEAALVRKSVTTVRMAGSEIVEVKQIQDEGLAMRVVREKRIVSARVGTELGREFLAGSMDAFALCRPREFWRSLPSETGPTTRLDDTSDARIWKMEGAEVADLAQEMINSASGGPVAAVSGSLTVVAEEFHLVNSRGLHTADKSTYVAGMINADADLTTAPASGFGHQSCRTLDAFLPEKIGRDAAEMCTRSSGAIPCSPGEYSIIFEPYSVGEILAFVAAPNFDHRRYSEGRSCLAGMIGREVSNEGFGLYDDPHAPQGIGSRSIDDEGVATRLIPLINEGRLEGTYRNLYDAFKEKVRPTGNGLRAGSPMGRSATPVPASLPHNLRVQRGDMSPDELVRQTRRGLLIGRLWYTYAVNPLRGIFSCTARSGVRVIRDGEIVAAGRPVRIMHSLPALLANISGVGNDEKNILQWASLPSITPSIKVEGIRVSPA